MNRIFGILAPLKGYKMKVILSIVMMTLLFQQSVYSQDMFVLEDWKFRQVGENEWYKADVPGTVHTDLLYNKLINDPFYRLNEHNLQWIDKVDWEYTTDFNLTNKMNSADKLLLVFEGLDTYATVFLNNKLIYTGTNMFVGSTIELNPDSLLPENNLHIVFKSPITEGIERLTKYSIALPGDNDQSALGGLENTKVSMFTRKAGYHYGWDWGPRLVTSGIWRNVYIKTCNKATINDLHIDQISINQQEAKLNAIAEVSNFTNEAFSLNIYVNDVLVANKPAAHLKTTGEINYQFKITNPILWWPNGHGNQHLYTIRAEIVGNTGNKIDDRQLNIGLRTAQLIREADKHGESFYFKINGKPVFVKGANYIPNDVFLPRVTPNKYEHIISSAANANINMLRVWGGGIYENSLFYELCDKYGIMVWQDFMFACAMYPGNDEFLKEVEQEAIYNIKRLRNHPSIVLWCGNNEIEQAWAQYDENRGWGWKQRYTGAQREIIWKSYDTLFHKILPDLVKQYDANTDYWHSSPSAGMGKLASHTNTSGDMHYWGVWHGGEPIESFTTHIARFMSEYGFQSFPEYESVKQYSMPEDWNILSEVMTSHQRSNIGNQRINEYMGHSYKQPAGFEDQLYVGQLLQAEAMKTAIEAHRSAMPYCMGSLYWQLNDCWPVASWSGIDYYGRWKAMHYFVREAFKTQIVHVARKGTKLEIIGISDGIVSDVTLRVNLMDFSGKSLWNRSYSVAMPSNGSIILTSIDLDKIPLLQNKDNSLLYVTLVKNGKVIDSDIYYSDLPKNLKLPFPDINKYISQKEGGFEIELYSKNLCKNLMLVSEGNAYTFSDNFFDILPGETRVIKVDSDLSYDEFERRLSYIHLQMVE